MSTEVQTFTLASLGDSVERTAVLEKLENEECHFVRMDARLKDLGGLGSVICALRARNVAALVNLADEPVNDPVEAASAISVLREWDQLSLLNLVRLCRYWLPVSIAAMLEAEAKIEQMWMREWLSVVEDPRVAKVPGLPWRRFIRKIVQENFEYADSLFDLSLSDEPDKLARIESLSAEFLANKKKVVSIFPKNWSSKQ